MVIFFSYNLFWQVQQMLAFVIGIVEDIHYRHLLYAERMHFLKAKVSQG